MLYSSYPVFSGNLPRPVVFWQAVKQSNEIAAFLPSEKPQYYFKNT